MNSSPSSPCPIRAALTPTTTSLFVSPDIEVDDPRDTPGRHRALSALDQSLGRAKFVLEDDQGELPCELLGRRRAGCGRRCFRPRPR